MKQSWISLKDILNSNQTTTTNFKMCTFLSFILLILILTTSCVKNDSPKNIDLEKNWRFSPDEKNIGKSEKWYSVNFDDSQWAMIDAGKRWEDLGYRDLDSFGWYKKTVEIPLDWKGKDIWLKIEGANDAYELFINGESVSYFGEANISVASRPTFTEISKKLKYGTSNLIVIQVNDWGNRHVTPPKALVINSSGKISLMAIHLILKNGRSEALGHELPDMFRRML
jgi:hypothetical protein